MRPDSTMMRAMQADLIVIGGGIVGLATGATFARRTGGRVVVLEKESTLAAHQTGRNSGVVHSGLYYRPGSLKASLCRRGKSLLEAFCSEERVAFETCGKVVVATAEAELPRLRALLERGRANGVACRPIDREQLRALEPHVAGIEGIHVPETGIVDYRAVCERLADRVRDAGGEVITSARVTAIDVRAREVIVRSTAGEHVGRRLANCGGLFSDRIARLAGAVPTARIVPFRGEYFELVPEARSLCRNLIYPVPDPAYPFLGVHLTRMIGGGVECGPNAVLALAREGYGWGDVDLRDLGEIVSYGGFWRLVARHWRTGAGEAWRSLHKAAFVRALQRLVPEIRAEHLVPAPAGVRAQALAPDGTLVDDFLLVPEGPALHVLNAPSPAATASLAIAEEIAGRLVEAD